MIIETEDIVAVWLGDATNGVNALLPGIALLSGDTQPGNVTVLSERSSGNAAREELPQDQATPVLIVGAHTDATYVEPFDAGTLDADIEVDIQYAIRNVLTEGAMRDGLYTIRAVVRSLRKLWSVGTLANRQRGTVNLVHRTHVKQIKPWTPIGDVTVTHGIQAGYRVRDTSP